MGSTFGAVYMHDCGNSVSMRVCVCVCVCVYVCVYVCVRVCVCEENRYRQISTSIGMSVQYMYWHVSAPMSTLTHSYVQVHLSVYVYVEVYVYVYIYICKHIYVYFYIYMSPKNA